MTTNSKKKKLAAVIGVMHFLKEEKEHIRVFKFYFPTLPTLWASYGRQQIMVNNQLMQRRAIRR